MLNSKSVKLHLVSCILLKTVIGLLTIWIASCKASESCDISRTTMQVVQNCPDTYEKRTKAAANKNCTAYASHCEEPDRLEYHCVINAFRNLTLEVCAYGQTIVFGLCTEYNIGGNIVHGNFKSKCNHFSKNPCPNVYRSTEAYKYPECYIMAQNSDITTSTLDLEATDISSHVISGTNNKKICFVLILYCFIVYRVLIF